MQLQASRYSACFYYKKLAGNMVMCWLYLISRFPISVMSVTRVCYYYYCFFFLIIKKWKSERPNKILGPNLGFGGSKIGMSRQNRDTWQIWGTDSCHYYFNPGQYSTFDFYIGLAQFRRPYVPIFRSFSYKNAGFKSKKNNNEANTKRKSAETRRIFMPEWHILRSLLLI